MPDTLFGLPVVVDPKLPAATMELGGPCPELMGVELQPERMAEIYRQVRATVEGFNRRGVQAILDAAERENSQ